MRRSVSKTAAPEDIHDLRVASRRFRAALDLFGPIAASKNLAARKAPKTKADARQTKLRKSVRKLTRTLGGLRNIDEALLFFQSRASTDVPEDFTLSHTLSGLRSRELKRIKKALKSFDCQNLDRTVRKLLAMLNEDAITDLDSSSLPAYFSDVAIRKYQPIHRLLPVCLAPEHKEARHALRIAIKKWRYFIEIVALVLERDSSQALELLKEYQSLLGRMNDIAEFRTLLGKCRLSTNEREYVEATFQAEEALLLEKFRELAGRKPLGYTFPIQEAI